MILKLGILANDVEMFGGILFLSSFPQTPLWRQATGKIDSRQHSSCLG
jgi:hypothetical protein